MYIFYNTNNFISQLSVFGAKMSRLETCIRSITLYSPFCQTSTIIRAVSRVDLFYNILYKSDFTNLKLQDSVHNVYRHDKGLRLSLYMFPQLCEEFENDINVPVTAGCSEFL